MEKVALKDIYDPNGILLISKGIKITEDKLSRLRRFGIEEESITDVIATKDTLTQNKHPMYEEKAELDRAMRGFREKIRWIDPEVFDYCSKLLIQILFARQTMWRMYMIGLANYAEWIYAHSINVAVLSLMIGKKIGMKKESLQTLALSALLHDVGFLLVPKTAVIEMDKEDKREIFIEQHSELGKALLDEISIDETCKKVVLQHHERLDGSGYPYGLSADEISFFAKIVMIADTFDLDTSEKYYGGASSPEEAVFALQNSGNKFDPHLVAVLAGLLQ
ncbi:MAG: HD domain-containing protein [Firmicutes bacterium]|nr:HD domain-containing protein [Bacillota bacterium]